MFQYSNKDQVILSTLDLRKESDVDPDYDQILRIESVANGAAHQPIAVSEYYSRTQHFEQNLYAIFDVPLDTFEEKGKIDEKMVKIGNVIPMTDNKGNKHFGEIIAISKNAVTLDFNHPLAGQDLRFTGKLISNNL